MKTFYLSLVGPFYGLYLTVKATDEWVVRKWANQELGPKVWCDSYTEEQLQKSDEKNINITGKTVIIDEDSRVADDKVGFDYR